MKKSLLILSAITFTTTVIAQNPFITDQFTADPTARVFEGKVYVYPSHDIPSPIERLKKWFCMADYHAFSSENLVDWTDHGVIISQDKVPWVNSESYTMWAPDCIYKNGKYFFYFPAMPKDSTLGRGSIVGVAVAGHPYGPFVPQPLPIGGIQGIDPCTLIDKDGQAYIYWAGRGLWMAKLKDNMLELASDPVQVQGLPEGFKEGPFVFVRGGKYYFTFPWVQDKTETLAYAMGNTPMGPFEFKGLIMEQSSTACWTNHHSIIEYKDQWYLFYHHNDFSPEFDKLRSIRIDSLNFNPDGTIHKVIPSLRGVGITDARKPVQLDRYSRLSGTGASIDFLSNSSKFEGWKTILNEDGAWVQYNRVDFGKQKIKKVRAKVASSTGGILQVRLDQLNGPVIAEIKVPKDTQWKEIDTSLSKFQAGVHDLFVSLKGDHGIEIDWIRFE